MEAGAGSETTAAPASVQAALSPVVAEATAAVASTVVATAAEAAAAAPALDLAAGDVPAEGRAMPQATETEGDAVDDRVGPPAEDDAPEVPADFDDEVDVPAPPLPSQHASRRSSAGASFDARHGIPVPPATASRKMVPPPPPPPGSVASAHSTETSSSGMAASWGGRDRVTDEGDTAGGEARDPSASGSTDAAASGSNASGPSAAMGRQTISYSADRLIGNGSFGVVFQAKVVETGETVAIKKVIQDKRYKNRELQIMRMLTHPNIVELKHCFYSSGEKSGEICLNLVLEFIPETVYRVSRHYSKLKQPMPMLYIRLYMYQLLRSLAYLSDLNIAHRDVKPQNLLVEPRTQVLKLCDFGSAKVLVPGEPSLSYIVSRFYRAVELIFGSTNYSPAIDLWSAGCVMAELLLGRPLFCGDSGVDQLVEIIKVLGTPEKEEIEAMNSNYTDFRFPHIRPMPWSRVFKARTDADAVDLVSRLLVYNPQRRIPPMEALAHAFFDPLRSPDTTLPHGKPLPPLFNFSEREWAVAGPELARRIMPSAPYEALAHQYGWPEAATSTSKGERTEQGIAGAGEEAVAGKRPLTAEERS